LNVALAALLITAAVGCSGGSSDKGATNASTQRQVHREKKQTPTTPTMTDVNALVAALGNAGIGCLTVTPSDDGLPLVYFCATGAVPPDPNRADPANLISAIDLWVGTSDEVQYFVQSEPNSYAVLTGPNWGIAADTQEQIDFIHAALGYGTVSG
jgi:hypothetical protein